MPSGLYAAFEGHDASAQHPEIVLVLGLGEVLHRGDVTLRQDQDVSRPVGKAFKTTKLNSLLAMTPVLSSIRSSPIHKRRTAPSSLAVSLRDVRDVVLAPTRREPLEGH